MCRKRKKNVALNLEFPNVIMDEEKKALKTISSSKGGLTVGLIKDAGDFTLNKVVRINNKCLQIYKVSMQRQ